MSPETFVKRHTLTRRRNPPGGTSASTCAQGGKLGTATKLEFVARDGSQYALNFAPGTRIRVDARGNATIVGPELAKLAPYLPGKPTAIEYTHAVGNDDYTHDFSRRATAVLTQQGIKLTGCRVKPFIEG